SRTNGAVLRVRPATARASAAIAQITGLPVQIFRIVVGFVRQSTSRGQVQGRGRSVTIAHAVTPSGISHHATAYHESPGPAASVQGANSQIAIGGYRTSPGLIS